MADAVVLAAAAGFVVGGAAGFFVGLFDGGRAVAGMMAQRWLELHPDEGDVRIRPGDRSTVDDYRRL